MKHHLFSIKQENQFLLLLHRESLSLSLFSIVEEIIMSFKEEKKLEKEISTNNIQFKEAKQKNCFLH
jgi:hypothetical protein